MCILHSPLGWSYLEGTMTKWPVQKLAQGTTQKLLQHHDATDILKTYIFVFFGFFCFYFLFIDNYLIIINQIKRI